MLAETRSTPSFGWRFPNQLVDAASSVFFRVVFGAIMAHWAWDYLSTDRVGHMYVAPRFHFTYYLLDWIEPWGGNGMYLHFVALCLLALAICIGLFYRLASSLFACGFVYVFLLDRTNYQNHYYLIALISVCLPFLPLNRYLSVDAYRNRWEADWVLPVWVLFLLRFHIALPYFFGGIAKLDADWLLGVPMQQMLDSKSQLPILGPMLARPSMGIAFAWGGLLFDLLVVPALLWQATRMWAFAAAVGFHLLNAAVFDIHIFPWFMIAATPIFFEPSWPRRLLAGTESPTADAAWRAKSGSKPLANFRPLAGWSRAIIIAYCLFHLLWPLRHLAYPGNASWNERGHHFAWRMMLRGKKVVLGYAIRDSVTGKISNGECRQYLNSEQTEKFGKDPEMVLHMAHHLADEHLRRTGHTAAVHALVYASLNGRKPELMIDPNVDLSQEPRGLFMRTWIMPQQEPLRKPAWAVPPEKWREHLAVPHLEFMAQSLKTETTTEP